MALKALINATEYESLPDELKSEYVAEGSGYKLDVTPVGNLKLEDVTGLNNSLANAKKERNDFKKKLEAFGDLTPEQAAAAKKVADELGGMSLDEKTQAAVKQQEEALKSAHAKELNSVLSRAEAAENQLKTSLVDNRVREALTAEITEYPHLVLPLLTPRVQMKRVEDTGQYVAVVHDENGNPAVRDGQGNPMTIKDLVDQFRGDKQYAPLFKGTGSIGTGSGGASPDGSGGGTGGATSQATNAQLENGQFSSLEDLATGKINVTEG